MPSVLQNSATNFPFNSIILIHVSPCRFYCLFMRLDKQTRVSSFCRTSFRSGIKKRRRHQSLDPSIIGRIITNSSGAVRLEHKTCSVGKRRMSPYKKPAVTSAPYQSIFSVDRDLSHNHHHAGVRCKYMGIGRNNI